MNHIAISIFTCGGVCTVQLKWKEKFTAVSGNNKKGLPIKLIIKALIKL